MSLLKNTIEFFLPLGREETFMDICITQPIIKRKKLVTNGFIMAVSPSGSIFIASHRDASHRFQTVLYSTSTGNRLKQQPLIDKGYLWGEFLSEKEIIVLEHKRPGHRVKIYNIETGDSKEIINSSHSTWDDVPLTLSPNKKYCVYYKRDKSGLYLLDIKTKHLSYFHSGTIIRWAPDSKHFLVFSKKKFRLELCKFDDNKVSIIKDFGRGSVIGAWLTSMQDLLIADVKKENESALLLAIIKRQKRLYKKDNCPRYYFAKIL